MPMPSALSRIGIGLLRTKISVRSRAAPAFSLVCSHALLAVRDIPRLLVWKAPTSADALVGTSSLNSSPVGLIIQFDFVFRGQIAPQPDCWKPYASYLGKVKLNLDCWIFYLEGYVNIDRNREVRAGRMESVGFINIAPVDNHEAMVAPSSALGWQLALEGYKPKRG